MKEVTINLMIRKSAESNEDAFDFVEEVKEIANDLLPTTPFAIEVKINGVTNTEDFTKIVAEALRRDMRMDYEKTLKEELAKYTNLNLEDSTANFGVTYSEGSKPLDTKKL